MPITDPNLDPVFRKMVAAFEGDPETWRRVNRGLRDAIVDHAAAHTPYYGEVIRPGMPFEDIPILTKTIIRERLEELLAEGVPQRRRFPDKTSGSTGTPLRFYRDTAQGASENISADRFMRRLWRIPPHAAQISLTGRVFSRRRGLRRRPLHVAELGGGATPDPPLAVAVSGLAPHTLERDLAEWGRSGDFILIGFPSVLSWIADQVERHSIPLPRPPAAAVGISETLGELAFRQITRGLRCPAFGRYSANEALRMAGTLPGTRRYVFNPLLYHVELLDAGGEPCRPGETGRIVVTDLNNYVMPLIRYDAGDLAVASREGHVGGFPLVDEIVGRSSELLHLPGGKVLTHPHLNTTLIREGGMEEKIASFQCAQVGPNELDLRIVWRVEPTDALRSRAAEMLRLATNPDAVIRVTDLDEPERLPSGKVWGIRREY